MKTVDRTTGLVLGVPTLGRPVNLQWAFALAALHPPINFNAHTACVWGQEVADARNAIARQAVQSDARYVFFLGDDTEAPGHALKQLIYRMEHDPTLGVVGGIYCSKTDPPAPLVFRGNGAGSFWGWKLGEYFEVTGIGMDCTLIRVDALRALEEPWFKTVRDDGYLDGEAKQESWTEDLWFCNRIVEETEFRIFADSMVMCKHWQHLGGNRWRDFQLRNDSLPYRNLFAGDGEPGSKQILDVGCGPHHYDFGGAGEVTRVDIREECCPDYRADARRLPFDDDAFDLVFSSHTLEHFARCETEEVLREWLRVLKPGGELQLILPNLEWAAARLDSDLSRTDAWNVFYGSQEYPENFHKTGFTPATITQALEGLSLSNVRVEVVGETYNMIVRATK